MSRAIPHAAQTGGLAQPRAAGGADPRFLDAEALLERMRRGERAAAADFMNRFGSRLLRRVRTKLSQPMRRVFDSQDILSTLARRLDRFVSSGRLEAATEGQLWSLLQRMAEHAVVDKARVFRRLQSVETEDSGFARAMLARLRGLERKSEDAPEIEIDRAMRSLRDPKDQTILTLWLMGTPHATTAEQVGLSAAAVRQRWVSIRSRLRREFAPEA